MKSVFKIFSVLIIMLVSASLFAVDLKMVGIYITPDDPCAQLTQTTQVRGVIKSVDGVSPLIYISFGVDNIEKAHYKMENLPADVDTNIDFQILYPPSTIYKVWFKIEAKDASNDTNPNNNYAEKWIHIEGCPPGKPDLIAVKISFEPVAFGKNYDVKIKYKVKNSGSSFGPSIPSEAQIKIKDQIIATCQVPALQLSEEYECQTDWKVNACEKIITLVADSTKVNDETWENNNEHNMRIKCKVNEWMRDSLEIVPVKK
jgi:hypothetical protein